MVVSAASVLQERTCCRPHGRPAALGAVPTCMLDTLCGLGQDGSALEQLPGTTAKSRFRAAPKNLGMSFLHLAASTATNVDKRVTSC